MSTAEGLIFDVDGTLYPASDDLPFDESDFGKVVYANTILLFQNLFDLEQEAAIERYTALRASHPGSLGKALEDAHGIPRKQYYDFVWDIHQIHTSFRSLR